MKQSFNHFWQRWLARGCEHGRNNTEIKQIRLFNAISIPSIAFLCATGALHLKNTAVEAAAVLFMAALALVFSILLAHRGRFHSARRMYIAVGISIIVLNQAIYGKTVYAYLTIFSIIGIQLLLFEYSTLTSKYGPPLILALTLSAHKWSGLFITPIDYPNGANFYAGVIANVLIIFLCFRSLLKENTLAEAQLVSERDLLIEANAALNLKEKNLVDARLGAEEANKFKGIFLAKISHELRTPMNGVLGMAQLLQDTELSSDQRDFANLIVSSGHQQLSIINTLLDFAKIDAGKMLIEKHSFSLRDLLNGLAKSFAAQCSIKGLNFVYEIAVEVPTLVSSDSVKLNQILLNILSNAIKFTDKGQVSLRVSMKGTLIQFEVSDSGIGLTQHQIESIFVPFKQGEDSTTRRFGGTGLGLSIVHELVTLLGGTIAVEGALGRGSTFTIQLLVEGAPNVTPITPKLALADYKITLGLRILVVEDNETNVLVVSRFLSKVNAAISVARDGVQAVEICATQTFDLILMDLHMPRMGGLAAGRIIRELEHGKKLPATPIYILSADAQKEVLDQCREAEFDGFIEKPILQEKLYAALGLISAKIATNRSLPLTTAV